ALNEAGKGLKGSRILTLGVAYKPDVDDLRESPALDLMGLLEKKGAQVTYHDPYIPHVAQDGTERFSVPDLMAAVRHADCVVIITNHSQYDYAAIVEAAQLVVDTRNALGAARRSNPKIVSI
ncbi:MAG: UDP binding domain-containing protein, partial [Anaerolineaceae bacterium]